MKRRLSKPLEVLRNAAQSAERRVSKAKGSYGAASDVRIICPQSGKTIATVPRRIPQAAERMSLWQRKTVRGRPKAGFLY
jgi:hypothetical protein